MKTRVDEHRVTEIRAEIGRLNAIIEKEELLISAKERGNDLWNVLSERLEKAKKAAESGYKRHFENGQEDRLAAIDYGQMVALDSFLEMFDRAKVNIEQAKEKISLYRQKLKRASEHGGMID